MPKSFEIPITSPVDFISGPSRMSAPGNLRNGNTDSLTKMRLTFRSSVSPCWASVFPAMIRAATFARGTPVALLTKGVVREARGFTSSTYTTSFLIAYWTFIRPLTPRARPRRRVCCRIVSRWGAVIL